MSVQTDPISEHAWRIRAQVAGAIAMLRDSDKWEKSDTVQAVDRLLSVAVEMSEVLADSFGNEAFTELMDETDRADSR